MLIAISPKDHRYVIISGALGKTDPMKRQDDWIFLKRDFAFAFLVAHEYASCSVDVEIYITSAELRIIYLQFGTFLYPF